jgi:hemerythrin-like domain-containing protein
VCPSPYPPAAIVETPLVDVRDMIVVHTAMLREFRLAPKAVARVPAGAHRATRRVNAHLELLCDLLHHHHAGEDELLWPPLRALLTVDGQARLDEAEGQHADIAAALRLVNTARHRWIDPGEDGSRDQLIAALQNLHGLLVTHLDTEERELLPLASAHLTPSQWAAVGEAGAASVPKSKMLLVLGMFAYEGDPNVLATMLHSAPPPARAIAPLLAPRIYARYAKRIHGTPRP